MRSCVVDVTFHQGRTVYPQQQLTTGEKSLPANVRDIQRRRCLKGPYCRPNARSPQGCEIYLTPSDFYLLSRSIIQSIKSHFKYGQGLFLDTVDSDDLA